MTAKTVYSDEVSMMRLLAETDHEISRSYMAGKYRKQKYGHNWQTVDLDEFVETHVPDCEGPELVIKRTTRPDGTQEVTAKYYYYYNKDKTKAVVVDFGGGYCRLVKIGANRKETYLDIHGNDYAIEILPNGHRRSRTRAEREEISHFIIKKKGK